MLCFTNNIPQRDGGSHLAGFRQALTRMVSKYAEGMGKKDRPGAGRRRHARRHDGRAVGEGAGSEILLSQTKDKLVSSEVQPVVQAAAADADQRIGSRPIRRRRAASSRR